MILVRERALEIRAKIKKYSRFRIPARHLCDGSGRLGWR